MRATMNLLGLYNYDNTILDGLVLPSNFEVGDIDHLKENLLIQTSEFEILYPEPSFLKYAITQWCKKHFVEWEELRKTQLYDYNPIWNADYKISDQTDTDRDLTGTNDTVTDFTRGLTDNETAEVHNTEEIKNHINERSGDDTTTTSVFSYNENSTAQPREKSKTDYNSKNTENGKTLTDGESSRTLNQTGGTNTNVDNDTTERENTNVKYERWLRGNYGVKTTQAMIEEQRELVKFNLFDYIINQFKDRFCIVIY